MTPPKNSSLRRRRHMRFGQSGLVTVHLALSYPGLGGSLFDIGNGGCLVWMDAEAPFQPGEVVEVRLKCGAISLRVLGSIRHTDEKGRILGIEFHRLNPKAMTELEAFIEQLGEEAAKKPADGL